METWGATEAGGLHSCTPSKGLLRLPGALLASRTLTALHGGPARGGTALVEWLSNTEKAKHRTEAWLPALRGGGENASGAEDRRSQGLLPTAAGKRYAEETFGCCGGCIGCAVAACAWEVLLELACWVDSWDNWSLLDRDFNSAFSRSSKEFLSTNSFICSFRTSTSSLTAYIKWLFTRSCEEQDNT